MTSSTAMSASGDTSGESGSGRPGAGGPEGGHARGPEVGRGGGSVGRGQLPRTLLTALAPLSWGTTYVVTTELLPPGHPLLAGVLRALPAGLIALALTRTLPRGTWWGKAGALGMLNIGLFFPLLFIAAERLPGGVAATLTAAQPLLVALLAVVVLRERLSAWRLGWGLVGVAGVGLVVIGPAAAFDTVGVLAGIGCAATMALGLTLTKRWGRPAGVSPTALAGWQLTAGGLFLVPLTLAFEGAELPPIGVPAVLGYAWLGLVGGLLAYAVWFRGGDGPAGGVGRRAGVAVAVVGCGAGGCSARADARGCSTRGVRAGVGGDRFGGVA